jgi:hypothetical protein
MPHLSPQTLTEAEQRALLRASAASPRAHLIFSLVLAPERGLLTESAAVPAASPLVAGA